MFMRTAAVACLVGTIAAGAARADATTPSERLVVFPLDGVNVPAETTRAATEIVASSLRDGRVDVIEAAGSGDAVPQTAVAPPPDPQRAPAAEMVVDRATPPAYPGMAAFAGAPDTAIPAAAEPAIAAEAKLARVRELGGTGYVDGGIVRLGSEIRVSIAKRGLDGEVRAIREATVRTDDALAGAVDLIARALIGDPDADAMLKSGGAKKRAAKMGGGFEHNLGAVIGGMFGVADTMDLGMIAGFDARFERGHLLVIANAGFALATPDKHDMYGADWGDEYDYDDDYVIDYGDGETGHPTDDYDLSGQPPGFQLWFAVDVAGYLGKSSVAPYLGAGVGAFIGGRVHVSERVDLDGDPTNGDDASRYWDSTAGLDVHPTFGIEFLRRGPIRLHLEARYTCNFSVGGEFGHGPLVLAGVNF